MIRKVGKFGKQIVSLWILLAVFLSVTMHLQAQFLRVQVKIPPKSAFYDMTMPEFGNLYSDAGWISISPGDPRIGSFSISNFENVQVMVGIVAPGALVLDEQNQLPLQIEAGWLNDGTNRPDEAVPFEALAQNRKLSLPAAVGTSMLFRGDYATFNLRNTAAISTSKSGSKELLTAWVYLFGSLYVGKVKPGVYTGEVFVTTEYE